MLRKLSLALTLICGLASAPASADSLDGIWHLIATMGQRAPAPLSLTFQDGTSKFTGQAPCNRFFGTATGHFPQLSLQNFGATRMACPDLQTETSYFRALNGVKMVEFKDTRLFLSGSEGVLMELVRNLTDAAGQPTSCLSCID